MPRCMSALRFFWVTVTVVTVLFAGPTGTARAQPDSVRTAILKEKGLPLDHTPRRALWRAGAVPGWGQIYNRQYYKLPFVYGGLAGLGFLLKQSISRLNLFREANLFVIGRNRMQREETDANEYAQFEPQFERASAFFRREPSGSQLRSQRDRFRRRRNLSILGIGLFYTLTLVDAFISAHLLTFDVDDELAVNVAPVGPIPGPGSGSATSVTSHSSSSTQGFGVRVRLDF